MLLPMSLLKGYKLSFIHCSHKKRNKINYLIEHIEERLQKWMETSV
jgi:hypothetical protein